MTSSIVSDQAPYDFTVPRTLSGTLDGVGEQTSNDAYAQGTAGGAVSCTNVNRQKPQELGPANRATVNVHAPTKARTRCSPVNRQSLQELSSAGCVTVNNQDPQDFIVSDQGRTPRSTNCRTSASFDGTHKLSAEDTSSGPALARKRASHDLSECRGAHIFSDSGAHPDEGKARTTPTPDGKRLFYDLNTSSTTPSTSTYNSEDIPHDFTASKTTSLTSLTGDQEIPHNLSASSVTSQACTVASDQFTDNLSASSTTSRTSLIVSDQTPLDSKGHSTTRRASGNNSSELNVQRTSCRSSVDHHVVSDYNKPAPMPSNMRNEQPFFLIGLCLRACYDNPLFTEDDDKAERGGKAPQGRAGSARQAQDGRVPAVAKDYMHSLPPGPPAQEVRFKSKARSRKLLKFVVVVVVIAVIVAIAVGIIVNKLHNQGSSLRTSPHLISTSKSIRGSLTIAEGPFSVYKKDYEDKLSPSFSYLLESFKFKMETIFSQSDYRDLYSSADILQITSSEGKVVVHFIVVLRQPTPLTSSDVHKMTSLIQEGLQDSVIAAQANSVVLTPEVLPPTTTILPPDECEVVRIPDCANMTSYTYTAFPNILGHPTQEIAAQAFQQMSHSIMPVCHAHLNSFMCSLYAPECGANSKPIPPCRSFCEVVYGRCNGTLSPGATFPVDCRQLPESDDPNVCMPNPYKPGKCIPIHNELCKQEGFNSTAFPNLVGNEGEGDVKPIVNLIKGVEAFTACYKHSMLFGCSAYLSPCSGNSTLGHHFIPPCRSLCQAYRDRCEIFLDIFNSPWPEELNCDRLPDSPDTSVCIGYKEAREPPDPISCNVGEMSCDNNTRCIQASWVCDNYQDCLDNSDERHCANCPAHEKLCAPTSTLCVNVSNFCDGDDHCYEGVDEAECVRIGDGDEGIDGRILEVHNHVSNQWEEVCASGWNHSFSLLTCRQLGYSDVLSTTFEITTVVGPKAVLGEQFTGGHPDRLQSYLFKGQSSCPGQDQYVVKLICWDPVCGTRPAHYKSALRVVGGDEVKPGTWPWMVSLHGGVDEKFFCGASVISPEWVLTAGHCVGGGTRETKYWTIIAGHTRRPSYSPHRQVRKPRRLFLHPEFNPSTVNNDLALIQLDKPLVLDDYLRPVCLPEPGQQVELGTRCYVAGWGKQDTMAATYEPAVRQVNLDVVTWESCLAAVQRSEQPVPYKLTHNMFCAGGAAGHDACQGDSGGPFMCRKANSTDEWYQAGIVSWGIGCAIPNVPGIYTKLALYVDWITETMANNTLT